MIEKNKDKQVQELLYNHNLLYELEKANRLFKKFQLGLKLENNKDE